MDKLNYIETLDDALLPSFDMIGIQSLRWFSSRTTRLATKPMFAKPGSQTTTYKWLNCLPVARTWIRSSLFGTGSTKSCSKHITLAWQSWNVPFTKSGAPYIPRSLCVSLFESMPKRTQACTEAKGGHFDYWSLFFFFFFKFFLSSSKLMKEKKFLKKYHF
jgi:hypothetical protein